MTKSEERFRLHEHKYLLEIDRERQKFISLKKELNKTLSLAKSEKNAFLKEIANLNKVNFSLNNKIGAFSGQVQGLKQRQAQLIKQLKVTEKKTVVSLKT